MTPLVNIRSCEAAPVKELVVISGKGGTGKTSLVASFAALAKDAVLADCDVDAADLHLLTSPHTIRRESFTGGRRAQIDVGLCTTCAQCEALCRFDAIHLENATDIAESAAFRVDSAACEGCGVCVWFCPAHAIELTPAVNGEWFVSETRFGPMVHARLGVAEENSGKLVSIVRTEAKQLAEERGSELVIVDGSPGIGCPVIASITGANLVVVVTEPTPSGLHDMQRVAELIRHFDIPAVVCLNKWDLNAEMSTLIEAKAREQGMALIGRIRYDRDVTFAQIAGKTVVEYSHDGSAADIRQVWEKVSCLLLETQHPLRK
jgi:MinD superfamily P-loop ATPase